MKFSLTALTALLLTEKTIAFAPHASVVHRSRSQYRSNTDFFAMTVDMPDAPALSIVTTTSNLPVIQANSYGQPTDVRYSDLLKLINADRIEKVTFSADGSQLLGVDVDGARLKIETLPNDPDLLTQLTNHKVRKTYLLHCYHFFV